MINTVLKYAIIIGSALVAFIPIYVANGLFFPFITGKASGKIPDGRSALWWALALTFITAAIAMAMSTNLPVTPVLISGLCVFGVLFAINSSLHSYLIVSYAKEDGASLDVGFYYMANAAGRLLGTVLSGWFFQIAGLTACLWISAAFITTATLISWKLPRTPSPSLT